MAESKRATVEHDAAGLPRIIFAQASPRAASVSAAENSDVVVFAAGNGHFGLPGQHPDVISAGGVFVDQSGATQAPDYASGIASEIYPGRNVPDLSGLVGMRPREANIMLPVEPEDDLDQGLGNGSSGSCSPCEGMAHPAAFGADLATGHGLVDAARAVLAARGAGGLE